MPDLREPTYCPYCNKLMQAADAPEDLEAHAAPGMWNICLTCLNLSIYDGAMHLRKPTSSEFLDITVSNGEQIEFYRQAIREAKASVARRNTEPVPASRDVN
jgi:hypothetical protein